MSHRIIGESIIGENLNLIVDAECDTCHSHTTFTIPRDQWRAWKDGGLIQRVMPSVPHDDREILISGTCSPCFDALFVDDEEDLDNEEIAF